MLNQKKKIAQLFRYILPTMIVLFIFVLVSQITLTLTKREAKETSTNISGYFVQNMEDSLNNLQLLTYEVFSSKEAEKLQHVQPDTPLDDAMLNTAVALGNELFNYCQIYDLIADAVIYYPDLDLTVSRRSCLSSFQYLHLDNHHLVFGSEDHLFLSELFFSHKDSTFVVYSDPEKDIMEMFFVRTSSSANRILLLRLDLDEISNIMTELLHGTSLQYIAMVTKTGHICASAGTMDDKHFQTLEQLKTSLHNQIYIQRASSVWNADFCFVQNNSEAYRFANTLFTISILAATLSAVLGLILAVNVYIRNSRREASFLQNLPFELHSADDVFSAINGKLNKMYEENIDLIHQMDRQRHMVASAFLKELLNMQNASHIDVERLCAIYDVTFENDCFALFLSIPKSNSGSGHKEQILDMIEEAEQSTFTVLWTKYERVDVFLCNFEAVSHQSATSAFQKLLEQRLPSARLCPLPQALFSVASVPEYFRSQYAQIVHSGRPLLTKKPVDEQHLTIRLFLEAVRQMQLDEALELLGPLSQGIIQMSQSNEGICQMHTLLGSLYRMPIMQPYLNELDYLFSDSTGKSWSTRLDYILRRVSMNSEGYSSHQGAVEQAYGIILKEYDNAQLSLSLLSERLGVSQSYLSRAFKQRYGENVLHFLNRTRVEHAKEYLLQTNDSINAIALRVGFLSDMNLIRVFKKLEDETPGSFRKRKTL